MTAISSGPLGGSAALFTTLRGELDALQRQLGTGRKAETYGGLGPDRVASLDIRGKLAALAGTNAAIDGATLRLNVMSAAVTRLTAIQSATQADLLPTALKLGTDGRSAAQARAETGLKEAIDLLNQDVAGRQLFAGRATDVVPVESYDRIMDGDPAAGRDGLKTLIAERKAADLGDGLGRLAAPLVAGATVTLSESTDAGVRQNFGFLIQGGASSSTAITRALGGGPPATLAFTVASQPAEGDTVQVALALRDGTTETITLVARANPGSEAGAFGIGASAADTAANLGAALDQALRAKASTALPAMSAVVAARDFFEGSATNPPRRVSGPPFEAATGFEPAGSARPAVIWYRGDDAASSARETAPLRIDATQSVGTGAQANEAPIRSLLASLGVLAAESFGATDQARYAALTDRASAALAPGGAGAGLAQIAADFGIAQSAMQSAKERHEASASMLEDALSGIEQSSPESTAAAILSLQTKLQASYQVTAMLSRLNLVNYL